MNHILDYFKKYSAITQNGAQQKKIICTVLKQHNLVLHQDAVMIKGSSLKIFCTTAVAAYIRNHESVFITELRALGVHIARISTVIVA